jgi:hypothetical protein
MRVGITWCGLGLHLYLLFADGVGHDPLTRGQRLQGAVEPHDQKEGVTGRAGGQQHALVVCVCVYR